MFTRKTKIRIGKGSFTFSVSDARKKSGQILKYLTYGMDIPSTNTRKENNEEDYYIQEDSNQNYVYGI